MQRWKILPQWPTQHRQFLQAAESGLSSVYFSAETKCKLSVQVEFIQLIEAGTDIAKVADYLFDN